MGVSLTLITSIFQASLMGSTTNKAGATNETDCGEY